MTEPTPSDRYRINAPAVVGEVVEGEVIVIHLETGHYYSLGGPGITLWECLAAACSQEAAVETIRGRYEGDPDEIDRAIATVFSQLVEHGLIVPTDEPGGTLPPPASGPREVFVAPDLEHFIDMQNLIQLDPILEVDDQGWPVANDG